MRYVVLSSFSPAYTPLVQYHCDLSGIYRSELVIHHTENVLATAGVASELAEEYLRLVSSGKLKKVFVRG